MTIRPTNRLRGLKYLPWLLCFLFSGVCIAAPERTEEDAAVVAPTLSFMSSVAPRLMPFEPTYAIRQKTPNGEDESAVEFHYSFKYTITPPECSTYIEIHESCNGFEWFIGFVGEFDFYLNTRPSSPVQSRLFNPSSHFRYFFRPPDAPSMFSTRYVGLGIQHYSNGQSLEVCDPTLSVGDECVETRVDDETLAELFLRDPGADIFDEISQGLNFVSLHASIRLGMREGDGIDSLTGGCLGNQLLTCWDLDLQVNPYMWSDDNPITWGRRAEQVSDYYRGRVSLGKLWSVRKYGLQGDIAIRALWTVGDRGFNTDSLDVSLQVPISLPLIHRLPGQSGDRPYSLPLFFEYHTGPMNNLSDYARSITTWGLGVKFGGR